MKELKAKKTTEHAWEHFSGLTVNLFIVFTNFVLLLLVKAAEAFSLLFFSKGSKQVCMI